MIRADGGKPLGLSDESNASDFICPSDLRFGELVKVVFSKFQDEDVQLVALRLKQKRVPIVAYESGRGSSDYQISRVHRQVHLSILEVQHPRIANRSATEEDGLACNTDDLRNRSSSLLDPNFMVPRSGYARIVHYLISPRL